MLPLFVVTTVLMALAFVVTLHKLDHYKTRGNDWFQAFLRSEQAYVDLSAMYDKALEEHAASEQGLSEIEENYQQELLDEYDKVKRLRNSSSYWEGVAEELEQIRQEHNTHCLPWIGIDFYPNAEEDETPLFDLTVQNQKLPGLF